MLFEADGLIETDANCDVGGQSYYPVQDVGWIRNEGKICVVEADRPGKFSFACWKKRPKLKEADWTQIGLVNGAVRYLDNKLCFIMFTASFADEFKNFIMHSLLRESVMKF
jgi:hypothetical protein